MERQKCDKNKSECFTVVVIKSILPACSELHHQNTKQPPLAAWSPTFFACCEEIMYYVCYVQCLLLFYDTALFVVVSLRLGMYLSIYLSLSKVYVHTLPAFFAVGSCVGVHSDYIL